MSAGLSWEEIVRRVTIESNYPRIERSAQTWRVVFDQIKDLQDLLRRLSDRSATWRGAGAAEFRKYLAEVGEALQKTDDAHRRIKDGLDGCHRDLKVAVESIPIPSWDQQRIQGAQQAFHSNSDMPNLPPNTFWNSLAERYGSTWAEQSVESWFGNRTAEAQAAYARLEAAYNGILSGFPQGTDTPVRRLRRATTSSPGTTQPAKKTAPRQPVRTPPLATNPFGNQTAMTTPPLQTTPPLTDPTGALTTPPLDTSGLSDLDPYVPSTGLAGATKPVDLASLGGGGFGGGGGGSGLSGLGKLPLGPVATVPSEMMTGGSMAGGSMTAAREGQQGRLAAAGGSGGAGVGGAGMVGAPVGGAPAGATPDAGGKDRRTGLQEDEDVFGPGEVTDWLVT